MAGFSAFGVNTQDPGPMRGYPNPPARRSAPAPGYPRGNSRNGIPSRPGGFAQGGPGPQPNDRLTPSKSDLADAWAAFHPTQKAPPPPEQDYDALFRASLDRQRTAIDAQLRQVMGDIGARHAQADKVVAMQPAEVNALYDKAAPAVNQAAEGAKASLASAGASAPTGAQDAGVQAIRAAIETNRGSALADAPYLQIGETDLFNRQAGAAQNAGQQAKAAVDAQLTDYLGQRSQTAYQAQLQAAAAKADFKRRLAAAAATPDKAQRENLGLQAATHPGTKEWWQAHALVDPEGANKMAANFNINPDTLKMWNDHPDIWYQAQASLTPELISFLKFNYGLK